MPFLAHGHAVLCLVIHACAASSHDSITSGSGQCIGYNTQLERALQAAEVLERQLRSIQREVEKSRRSVLEKQRALASCERSASTARYSFVQRRSTSDEHNASEVLAGRHVAAVVVRRDSEAHQEPQCTHALWCRDGATCTIDPPRFRYWRATISAASRNGLGFRVWRL